MANTDLVETILESLNESDEIPRRQVTMIIEALGEEAARDLLRETQDVENSGGMLLKDGSRRRTPGGVFFALSRKRLSKQDRKTIFRVRPPKPEGADAPETVPKKKKRILEGAGTPPAAARARPFRDGGRRGGAAAAAILASDDLPPTTRRRRVVEVGVIEREVTPSAFHATGGGRRRIHEVQPGLPMEEPGVLLARSAPAISHDGLGSWGGEAPAAEDRGAPPADQRLVPVRRRTIVRPREAADQDAATVRRRILELVEPLPREEGRRVLSDVMNQLGLNEPEPEPEPEQPATDDADAERTRERVLAAVVDALGLSATDLARRLYGDDSPSARARARVVLKRFREAKGDA